MIIPRAENGRHSISLISHPFTLTLIFSFFSFYLGSFCPIFDIANDNHPHLVDVFQWKRYLSSHVYEVTQHSSYFSVRDWMSCTSVVCQQSFQHGCYYTQQLSIWFPFPSVLTQRLHHSDTLAIVARFTKLNQDIHRHSGLFRLHSKELRWFYCSSFGLFKTEEQRQALSCRCLF